MSNTAPLLRQTRLLSSCAVAVIAALTVHMPVRGQALPALTPAEFQQGGFQGIGTPVIKNEIPTAFIDHEGTNTLVTVNSPRAIINWTPHDNRVGQGAVNFLPEGRSADFVNNPDFGVQDYIVLNRILPQDNSRAIALNGTITSTVNEARGGQVWFYSPGGILVGKDAIINVGSLLLTANDLNNQDGFIAGTSNTFSFAAAGGSRAAVEVQGTINAGSRNAYVALIAPRVVQAGNVTVNGSAAYVAAEKVDMTINGSLFDIAVPADGGSSFNGARREDAALVHEGNTNLRNEEVGYGEVGYGSQANGRGAIMVAVPKNDAVTMLVQGNVLYTQATNVSQVDGKIILSGGSNVVSEPSSRTHFVGDASGAAGKANVLVNGGTFGTDVDIEASGDVAVRATGSGAVTSIVGDLNVNGGTSAIVEATGGGRVDILDELYMDASGEPSNAAGLVRVATDSGSRIDIGGNANLFAETYASSGSAAEAINSGTAEIVANGGTINIGGQAVVFASGYAAGTSAVGGNASGGTARIVSTDEGQIEIGSGVNMEASGYAGRGTRGGSGAGGNASITADGGSITIAGSVDLRAEGFGEGGYGATSIGGSGTGGTATVSATNGAIAVSGNMSVEAEARGGRATTGGGALGGIVRIASDVGTLTSGGSISASADGEGGRSFEDGYGTGSYGTGEGGTVSLIVTSVGGTAGKVTAEGEIVLSASGFGGNAFGGEGGSFLAAAAEPSGEGGDGFGGSATASVNGDLNAAGLRLEAVGAGGTGKSNFAGNGAGDVGSTGDGGTATATFSGGTSSIGAFRADASGVGGRGGFGSQGGNGGVGAGGLARLTVTGGTTTATSVNIDANGTGGSGANRSNPDQPGSIGGTGSGGDALLAVSVGILNSPGGATVNAYGRGGTGVAVGGLSEGGSAAIRASAAGLFAASSAVRVDASGGSFLFSGNAGGSETKGGDSFGGEASVEASGGAKITSGSLTVEALGYGGFGDVGGGNGKGGVASILAAGGSIEVGGSVNVSATAFGGITFNGDMGYGSGSGGTASLGITTVGGIVGRIAASDISLQAQGLGDLGFSESARFDVAAQADSGLGGGIGQGGTVTAIVDGELETDFLALNADGTGGDGLSGNDERAPTVGSAGYGGSASLEFQSGNTTLPNLVVSAAGRGGNGGSVSSFAGGGNAAAGGLGEGGSVSILANGGTASVGELEIGAGGFGGAGGSGGANFGDEGSAGNGGDGGTGLGGKLTIGASIRGSSVGSLTLPAEGFDASGLGGAGGKGGETASLQGGIGGRGGDATGGDISIAVNGASVTIVTNFGGEGGETFFDSAQFEAKGIAGGGGDGGNTFDGSGTAGAGGAGGTGTGGNIGLTSVDAQLTLGPVDLLADGDGGRGGNGGGGNVAANGGRGGSAEGGSVSLSFAGATTLTQPAAGILVSGSAVAGTGGSGGSGISQVATSGAGGAAKGGIVTVDLNADNLTVAGLSIQAAAEGGQGGFGVEAGYGEAGDGGAAAIGGAGGNAVGGRIAVESTRGRTTFVEATEIRADGTGGLGGGSDALNAGAGGSGEGGNVVLQVGGTGELTGPNLTLAADGRGGIGGVGGESAIGGTGGAGGNGTGGTVEAATFDSGKLNATSARGPALTLQTAGIGGDGGAGGRGFFGGGTGGNAGSGTGGNALLTVTGGTMTLQGLQALADGRGGSGGQGGFDRGDVPTQAAGGDGAGGSGGNVSITVADFEAGPAGALSAGDTGLFASGFAGLGTTTGTTSAGFISIFEDAKAASGSLSFGNLTARSLGGGNVEELGFRLTTDNGRVDILGEASIVTDLSAEISGTGGASIATTESFVVNAGGSILLNQDAGASAKLISARNVRFFAGGSILGLSGAFAALDDIEARAGGDVQLGLGEAGDDILVSGATATIGRAVTDGSGTPDGEEGPGSNLVVDATGAIQVTSANVATDIRLTSQSGTIGGSGTLAAGRDFTATTPGSVSFGTVSAGDDIRIIASNATLGTANTSGTGEDEEGDGSDLVVEAPGGISLANADVADDITLSALEGGIVSTGTLKAGDDVFLEARNNIQTGNIDAGSVDLFSSLGNVTSTGTISGLSGVIVNAGEDIGLVNANATSGSIFLSGGTVSLTGTATARDLISVQGRGNVTLGDLTTTRGSTNSESFAGIRVSSGGRATIRSGNSAGAILVTSQSFGGGPLTAASLVRVEAFGNSGFDGVIDVGNVKAGTLVELAAFGNVTAAGLDAGSDAIVRSQTGAATVGTAVAGRDLRVTAQSIGLTSGTAGRDVLLNAVGDINVGFAQAGDDFRATSSEGAVTATTVVTTGLGPDSESGYGTLGGSNILVHADADARLDNGTTPGAITLASSTGSVRSAGLLQARRLVTSQALDIALTDVTVTESLFLSASAGSITGRNLVSGRDIDLSASGVITLAGATAARDIDLAASGAITIGTAQAGDDFIAESSSGSFVGGTITTTGLGEDISESGYGSGDGSNIFVDAATTIRLDNGNAPDLISLTARDGRIDGAGLIAATQFEANATSDIALNDVDVVNGLFLSTGGGSVTGRSFASDGGIFLSASDRIGVASLDAGESISLQASAIEVGSATAVRSIFASGGSVDFGSVVTTSAFSGEGGSGITVSATGDINIDNADSATFLLAEGANIAGGNLKAAQDVTLNASGNVAVQEARAGDDISIMAGGTALVGAAAAPGTGTDNEGDGFNISIEAVGNVSFGSADTAGNLRLVSQEGGIFRLGAPDTSLIEAGGNVFVSSAFDLNLSSVKAGGAISLFSDGAIDTGSLDGGSDITLDAGAALKVAAAKAGGGLFASGTSIEFGSVEIGGGLGLFTPGALVLGTATAASISGSGSSVAATTLTTPGAISLSAISGNVAVGTATAGTDIALSGAGVTLTDGTAGRDIILAATGDIGVGSAKAGDDFSAKAGGAFAGTTVITTGLGPDMDGDSGYGTTAQATGDGSNIKVAAGGAIALSTGSAKDSMSLASSTSSIASDRALTAGGSILGSAATTVTLASASAGQGIDVTAAGAINGATLAAGSELRLASTGGNVTLGSATAGDDIDVTASGTTTIASATTTGKAPDDGNNGASVLVTSTGGVTIQRIDSAGGVNLQAQNGAVLVSQDLKSARAVDASGRSVTLNAQDALAVRAATATGGNVTLTSAGNLTVEKADASAEVNASSAGTLALNGAVNGTQLTLASRDIAIGSAAQVGTTQRTTAIQITANGAGSPVVIGGAASGTGYRLDNAEFARLAARDVRISSQGESASLQVDALTVRGAGASNPNVTGRLTFAASGDVEMTGKLAFDSATEANSVRVSAGRTFFADAAGAGIAVTNGTALAGSVDIDARSIVVASRGAVTDLGSASTIDARSNRLGLNDGATDNAGFIRAGGIRLSASEKIHVQNSGANSDKPDDRAGLSAGAAGITLVTNSVNTPVEIIINGRQVNPAGGEFTGEALIGKLTITGVNGAPASFAARSTINGCIIGGSNCGVPVIEKPVVDNSPFTTDRNVIEELLEEQDEGLTRPPTLTFTRLIEVEQGPLLSVVDEPVTGTGNDDIYLAADSLDPACPDDRQDCVIDTPVTGTGNEERQGNADGTPTTTLERRPADTNVDAPVTGTGNETLQSNEPQDD